MPDTPSPPNTKSLAEMSGDQSQPHFTGDDLAKIVKPTKDLKVVAGKDKVIDDYAAQALISQRLGGDFNQEQSTSAGDISEIIVDALPPELRTATVMQSIDLRPYLVAIEGKKITHRLNTAWYLPDATGTIIASTKAFLDAAEQRAVEDAVVAGAATGTPVTTKYDPAKAGVVPTATATPVVDPVTGQVTTPGVTVNPDGSYSFGTLGSAGATSPFTIDDLRQMVQGDHWTLKELAANEDQSPTGQFSIELGTPSQLPGGGAGKAVSTNDALSYLRTQLTPQEIHNMQLKLASAGYFDKLTNGGNYIDGVVDDNTQAAWKLLLTDSVIQNRPAPVILGEGLRNYRDQIRKSRLGQLQQIDPSYTMSAANDYAQSVIGRDLTPDQIASLNQHLHGLVSARAGYVAGAPDNNARAGALANTPTGTTDKDIQAGLDANPQFKSEQRHQNDLALEYKLRQLMH